MSRIIAAALTLTAACGHAPPRPVPPPAATTPPEPTTTAATTTSVVVTTVVTTMTTTAPEGNEGAVQTGDDAFWRRLANCECESGRCGGAHVSFFQFSRDTARKVGIDGSESYEDQRAAAQEWARRIHPREGTTAGWPHCWWVAAA